MPRAPLEPRSPEPEQADAAFHDHLDLCAWCNDHPFNLCAIGEELLTGYAAAAELGEVP